MRRLEEIKEEFALNKTFDTWKRKKIRIMRILKSPFFYFIIFIVFCTIMAVK